MTKFAGSLALGLMLFTLGANGALVVSPADFASPVTTIFTDVGFLQVPGPLAVGGGISVTGDPLVALGDVTYNLGVNGEWDEFSWVGTNSNTARITFDLGGLFSAVGGFLNYSIATDSGPAAFIRALAADGTTVLEEYDLAVSAPISTLGATNQGAFRGVSRGSEDIRFFQLEGSFLVAHSLTTGVPEPSSVLFLTGGLLACFLARRHVKSPR